MVTQSQQYRVAGKADFDPIEWGDKYAFSSPLQYKLRLGPVQSLQPYIQPARQSYEHLGFLPVGMVTPRLPRLHT